MKNYILILIGSLTALAIAGCDGSGDGTDGEPPAPTNNQSGYCGSQVRADFISALKSCYNIMSQEQSDRCDAKAASFESNYPSINCQMQSSQFTSYDYESTYYNSSDFPTVLTPSSVRGYLDNRWIPDPPISPYTPDMCAKLQSEEDRISAEIQSYTQDSIGSGIVLTPSQNAVVTVDLTTFHTLYMSYSCANVKSANQFYVEQSTIINRH